MKKLRILMLCLAAALLCTAVLAADAGDFTDAFTGKEVAVTAMEFSKAKQIEKQKIKLSKDQQEGIANGDLLLVSFTVKAENACTPMKVTVGGKSMTYYVPVQWTKIVLAAAAEKNLSVELEPEAPILLGQAQWENCKKQSYEAVAGRCGLFLLEPYTYTALPETGVGAGAAKDVTKSGNFLYVLCEDALQVVDVTNPAAPKLRGKVTGLGTNTRQIALCDNDTEVMVTARAGGVFLIDVKDPDKPVLRSAYESIEMATGLAVAGNYAFIGNRQNGVEVVDFSDPARPRELAILRTGEVQSCLARNGILYCGLWNECRVDLYDISDPAKAKKVGTAPLNGKGDGVAVLETGGHVYLYAATGQHTVKLSGGVYDDPRYGMGNGLDIYDVTDPAKPKWLSTSKIDGRYYYQNNDSWTVKVAKSEFGKVYAYVTNTYNGVFVYDVTDPAAPRRLEKIDIPIPKDSPNYSLQSSGSNRVFPYDQTVAERSPVAGLWAEKGVLYLAGAFTDLHIAKGENFFPQETKLPSGIKTASEDYFAFSGKELPGFMSVSSGSLIAAVEKKDGLLYTAAGSDGILIYDEALTLQAAVPTAGICYDLTLRGDTLYTAEGLSGVAAYTVNGTTLTKKWSYESPKGVCRSVAASATGKFLAIQAGANFFELLNTEKQESLLVQKGTAQMYYRNLLSMEDGRYLGAWSNNGKEFWYDCGEQDKNQVPKLINTIDKTAINMAASATPFRGKMLALTANGYVTYDPRTCGKTLSAKATTASRSFTGKPTVYGNLLICTDRIHGHIYFVSLKNLTLPKVLLDLEVPGSPDVVKIWDGTVYIPMGYQGLIKFDLASFAEQSGLPFTDVSEGDWFFPYVSELFCRGTVSGMTDTTFVPGGKLTYGQALKLIVCGLGKGQQPAGKHWASGYLTFAKAQKWLDGDVDLNAEITRLAFCRIAARAKGLTAQPTVNPFTDCSDPDVLALVNAGVVSGMTETTFAPDSVLTRAQITKIIAGLIK